MRKKPLIISLSLFVIGSSFGQFSPLAGRFPLLTAVLLRRSAIFSPLRIPKAQLGIEASDGCDGCRCEIEQVKREVKMEAKRQDFTKQWLDHLYREDRAERWLAGFGYSVAFVYGFLTVDALTDGRLLDVIYSLVNSNSPVPPKDDVF